MFMYFDSEFSCRYFYGTSSELISALNAGYRRFLCSPAVYEEFMCSLINKEEYFDARFRYEEVYSTSPNKPIKYCIVDCILKGDANYDLNLRSFGGGGE